MTGTTFRPLTLPAEGGCRCGALRFRLTRQPLSTAVCHCTGCQHMSASAFSTTLMVPLAGFEVTRGETLLGGMKNPGLQHHHCAECLGWVYTRITGVDLFLNLRAMLLDDPSGFVPFIETWTSEKLPWAETPALHKYAEFPPAEAFGPLLAEYAALIAEGA